MSTKPKQKKWRDVALSTLEGGIQVLSLAKDACAVPPAQIALGSACVLLTTIKVRSVSLLDYELLTHVSPEHNGKQR